VGVSKREVARQLGVSDTAVRKAIKAGRIKELPDGTIDLEDARKAWASSTDPARTKVREPANQGSQSPAVRTEDEARAAVGLILKVLRAEGSSVDDLAEVDFGMARTADTILKAYERDLKMAQRRKELVPLATVKQHIEKAFIGYRQAIQRLPSRFAAQIAAEAGCDASTLDASLSKAIATVLDELSSPVVRA
jgi:DNA-binding MarR family transcriptional regulator